MTITADMLSVEIFADGADRAAILSIAANPLVKGFTTNPTLMRQAGVTDYESFARDILAVITDRPISFEVFSDDFDEMAVQARRIAGWAPNVYVKIPVTNTRGESAVPLIRRLAAEGVQMNVTALFTEKQIKAVSAALADAPPSNISVFAGRIADAGNDPVPIMRRALEIMRPWPQQKLIWASPREVYNVVQADEIGCHIITVTRDLIAKLASLGRDHDRILPRHGEDVPPRRRKRRLSVMTGRRADRISLVFPVAGNDGGENFRGFEKAGGETLIHRSLRAFLPFADRSGKFITSCWTITRRASISNAGWPRRPAGHSNSIRLSSPTRGPAESVARGIARHGITGPLIVCDIDHRLDAAPLFDAIAAAPEADALVSLWPLAGEQLRRWSVACLAEDDTVAEVAERRLPDSAGRFFGVIGCYYFPDAQKVMDCCLEKGFARFSDYFNHLAALGRARARGAASGGGILRRRRTHPPVGGNLRQAARYHLLRHRRHAGGA